MLTLTWIFALGPTAEAAPVLHADDEQNAMETVAEQQGGIREPLEDWPLSALLDAVPAVLVEGASTTDCDGALLTNDELGAGLDEAKGQLVYMQYSDAAALLDGLDKRLPCLNEAADPAQLARLGFLRGLAAAAEGRDADAVAAFSAGLSADPGLQWDADLPDTGRDLFDGLGELAEVPAQIVVHPTDAVVLVNGRRVEANTELAAGPHLLQVVVGDGWTTWRLDVGSGAGVRVVAPHAAGTDMLGWPSAPSGQGALDLVLSAEGSEHGLLFVVDGGDAWSRSAGTWTSLESPAKERSLPVQSITRWGGAGLLAVGAGVATVSYRNGLDAHGRGTDAVDEAAYLAAKPDYDAAARWLIVGDAAVLTGAAMVGVSFLW